VSADVNHGKQLGPVALPGSNQQHPATQTVRCEAHARAPDNNNIISSDHGSPGCSEDSPVERPEAGQRHENGNHGGQSVESAVCERLRGRTEEEHGVQYLPLIISLRVRALTDHGHGLRQQQLGGGHHGEVGHVDEHVEDGHHHYGADDGQRDVSVETGCTRRGSLSSPCFMC